MAQVFATNTGPASFYLYGTNEEGSPWALSPGQQDALSEKITRHGGVVRDAIRPNGALTVIANDEGVEHLRQRFRAIPWRYVEGLSYVDACIRNNRYAHEPVPQRPMSGRVPGATRVSFTERDERRLCEYLAGSIPDPGAGGRTGKGVYVLLLRSAEENPEHAWAKRHTVESWRERYKKHQARLDPIIADIVRKNPPPPDGQGLYPYNRRLNGLRVNYAAWENAQKHDDEYDGRGEFEREEEEEEEEVGEEESEESEESDGESVLQRHARAARRRTDLGPQRRLSTGSPLNRRSSAPAQRRRPLSPSPEGEGDFQPFDWLDGELDARPGQEEAGLSATQARNVPRPRPVARPQARAPPRSQVPMSSQATLVGPVPSQMQNAPAGQRVRDQLVAKKARLEYRQRPEIVINTLPPTGSRPRGDAAGSGKARTIVTQQQQEGRDEIIQEDLPPPYPVRQAHEEEQDVEELLGGEVESASTGSLESDDERAFQQLLSNQDTAREQKPIVVNKEDDWDDVDSDDLLGYAEDLDLTGPSSRRSSGMFVRVPATGSRGARNPITPVARQPSRSSESDVPLPGTRASAEKRKAKESLSYAPPPGTRAAEVTSAPRLQLRNRTVRRV